MQAHFRKDRGVNGGTAYLVKKAGHDVHDVLVLAGRHVRHQVGSVDEGRERANGGGCGRGVVATCVVLKPHAETKGLECETGCWSRESGGA